jgi:hypothetical protein
LGLLPEVVELELEALPSASVLVSIPRVILPASSPFCFIDIFPNRVRVPDVELRTQMLDKFQLRLYRGLFEPSTLQVLSETLRSIGSMRDAEE